MKHVQLIFGALTLFIGGCMTQTLVQDWSNLPGNSTIEVRTKNGNSYQFDDWKTDCDRSIVGTTKDRADTWTRITIQANSIAAVYVRDSQAMKRMETAVTVAGSLVIVAAVIEVIHVLGHVPGIPISFGP